MDCTENGASADTPKNSSDSLSRNDNSETSTSDSPSTNGLPEIELCPSCGRDVENDCNCSYGDDWDYAYERR